MGANFHNVLMKNIFQVIKRKKEHYYSRESRGEQSLYKKAINTSTFNEKEGNIDETSFAYIKDDLDENEENDLGKFAKSIFILM